MTDTPTIALVKVKSAWLSKVNWTQIVAALAMILAFVTGNKIELTATEQSAIIVVIGLIGQFATFILKTWFTPTVTPSSLTPDTITHTTGSLS
jgi:hypothetical protein